MLIVLCCFEEMEELIYVEYECIWLVIIVGIVVLGFFLIFLVNFCIVVVLLVGFVV